MYTKHFGLNKLPFENVPDPIFFFDEGDYARTHTRIKDSLKTGRGLMVIAGPIGSGKTTMSQMIISEFSNNMRLIWMAIPPSTSIELFLFIAQELGLQTSSDKETPLSTALLLRYIREALLRIHSEGNKCILIIDESHLILDDTINGIRLLNNLEEGSTKFIQILMLGQKELMDTINRPEMESFKQRIAALEILGKMNVDRIRQYISHRIKVAGGQPSIFTDSAWEAVLLASGSVGVPRIINSLCDVSLQTAFDRKKIMVDVDDVYTAADGMALGKEVFHYIVKLKNMEREKEVPSTGENGSDKESATDGKVPIQSLSKKSDRTAMLNNKIQSEPLQSLPKESASDFSNVSHRSKGLKIPILFLILSISALILSIFFYFQKLGLTE